MILFGFFKDGLFIKVTNYNQPKPFHLCIAWLVDINAFYDEIAKPVQEIFYQDQNDFLKLKVKKFEQHRLL